MLRLVYSCIFAAITNSAFIAYLLFINTNIVGVIAAFNLGWAFFTFTRQYTSISEYIDKQDAHSIRRLIQLRFINEYELTAYAWKFNIPKFEWLIKNGFQISKKTLLQILRQNQRYIIYTYFKYCNINIDAVLESGNIYALNILFARILPTQHVIKSLQQHGHHRAINLLLNKYPHIKCSACIYPTKEGHPFCTTCYIEGK